MSEQQIKGLSELQKFLDTLPAKLERNVMRGALREGATRELLPEAQANLASAGAIATGELITGLKVGTRARAGTVTASVKATGPHGHIAKWIEYGVRAHNIVAKVSGLLAFSGVYVKSVSHPGFKPKPFLRPALDQRGSAAVVAAAEYMKRRLATKQGLDTSGVLISGDES